MIKAIIFDCFGVIRPDRLPMTYRKFGGDPVADNQFIEDTIAAANHGMIPNSFETFAEKFGITADEWRREIEGGSQNDMQLLDFAADARRNFKVGLLTNASRGRMREIIGDDLERCFDAVAESGSMGYAKPEAEAYGAVADMLDVRCDECVMVDDREDYCQGARAVGMQAIQYGSFEQFKIDLKAIVDGA